MAPFGLILHQNLSHMVWDASYMPPGLQNPPKNQKSRKSRKIQGKGLLAFIYYLGGIAGAAALAPAWPDFEAAGPDFEAAGPDFEAAGPDSEAAGPDSEAAGPDSCRGCRPA